MFIVLQKIETMPSKYFYAKSTVTAGKIMWNPHIKNLSFIVSTYKLELLVEKKIQGGTFLIQVVS